jgi:hypothetical protein
MENDFLISEHFIKKCATYVLFNQRNGRNVIDIGVKEGLLGKRSSMKMNLFFDYVKKID